MTYTITYKEPAMEAKVYTRTTTSREMYDKMLRFCDERGIYIVGTEVNGLRTDDCRHHGVQTLDRPETRLEGYVDGFMVRCCRFLCSKEWQETRQWYAERGFQV